MELVVDANVLFAALIKEGKTAELLFNFAGGKSPFDREGMKAGSVSSKRQYGLGDTGMTMKYELDRSHSTCTKDMMKEVGERIIPSSGGS